MSADSIAVVRAVPETFADALVSDSGTQLDVVKAREQHARYLRALEGGGHEIVEIPADPAHPDCLFVEDTAVVVGGAGFITRPGAESRRGEVGPVAERLARWMPLVSLEAPGTLDGGDVIVAPGKVLVGNSRRTNREGIEALTAFAAEQGLPVGIVAVREGLHLKSAVLPLDAETMVVTRGAVDEVPLDGFRILYEADSERFRFSALPLATGTVVVTADAPRTVDQVVSLGFDVEAIEVSEIQAADGGLTCMSILFDAP